MLGKTRRVGRSHGPPAGLEEGVRDARRGPAHRLLRGRVSAHADRSSTSRPRPAAASRPASTSPRSRKTTPGAALLAPLTKSGGRNNTRPHHRRATAAAATSAATASIDFRRDKDGVPATVAAIEYDPNRSARIALLHYADGEKRYILAPVGLRVGDRVDGGPAGRHQAGQLPAAREHPARHDGPQRRAAPGHAAASSVRSAGGGVQLMAKEGDYALLKLPSGELRRVRIDVPRHHRPGRQPRAREHLARQGRPHALARPALARARHRDEPGRPSARRRRGPLEGQPSADAVGQADQGLQDPAQQADQPASSCSGARSRRGSTATWHVRSKKVRSSTLHLAEEGARR